MKPRKPCTRCGDSFTLDSFPLFKSTQNGKTYRQSWCCFCRAEYAAAWRERNPDYYPKRAAKKRKAAARREKNKMRMRKVRAS